MITLRRTVVASFAVALAIRLADVLIVGPIRTPDTAGFAAAALAMRGSILTNAEIFLTRPPVYALLLAIMPSDQVVVLIQAVLSAAVAPLIGVATARAFGLRAGVVAAIVAAVMPPFIEWTPYLLSDVLALALLAVAIERLSAAVAHGRARAMLPVGAAAAAAVLTRPAYTAAAAAFAVAAAAGRPRVAHFLAFAVGALLVSLPFLVRNVAATGTLELYEGRGWETLWEGTQWTEQGRGTGGVDFVVPPDIARLPSAEQTDFYRSETIRVFTERPVASGGLMLKKGLWYLLPFYPEWSTVHKLVSLATLGSLYVFALLGAWRHRKNAFSWALVLIAASFVGTTMLTVVDYDARYRLPFILALIPLAGAGAQALLLAPRSATRLFARSSISNDSPQSAQ